MKILKEGFPNKKEKYFKCSKCGCIFIANEDEYKCYDDRNCYSYSARCPMGIEKCYNLCYTSVVRY